MSSLTLSQMTLDQLLASPSLSCSCGKAHKTPLKQAIIGEHILPRVLEPLKERKIRRPMIVSDPNTYEAAGREVCHILEEAGVKFTSYVMDSPHPVPDEYWVGAVVMRMTPDMDAIIAVGSGVINDVCKIAASVSRLPYLIVGTAPSMDGYASDTSSMLLAGLKITLPSRCPDVIIADTAVMAQAPMRMLQSGLGDMVAKYVSICEWRISHIINDEYYCEEIASLVRQSLAQCMESADRLLERDPAAVEHVVRGLILTGAAMGYAGVSRPASGTEHYFSHIWDMTAIEQGYEHDLHGIQCGVSTLLSLKVYDYIRTIRPDRQKALDYVNRFSLDDWKQFAVKVFGKVSDSIIEREQTEQKYNKETHRERLEVILDHWDQILAVIDEELPSYDWLLDKMKQIQAPVSPKELNLSSELVKDSFLGTKDIRYKYISTHLLWDLGYLEDAAETLF